MASSQLVPKVHMIGRDVQHQDTPAVWRSWQLKLKPATTMTSSIQKVSSQLHKLIRRIQSAFGAQHVEFPISVPAPLKYLGMAVTIGNRTRPTTTFHRRTTAVALAF